MNLLQSFLSDANAQARPIVQEEFTVVGDVSGPGGVPVIFYGTFGDPQVLPIMTRQGYQDHLVTPLKAEANQTGLSSIATARKSLVRTQTGRTLFIQTVDYTAPVVFTFILTDREL